MKVHSEMVDEQALSDSNIDVDVDNSMVTLNGTMNSEDDKAKTVSLRRRPTASRS